MNTSVDNIIMNISEDLMPITSTSCNSGTTSSQNNISHALNIESYRSLQDGWNSYGAKRPNNAAIIKAINFIAKELNPIGIEVFFTAPTPDGDILVEIKNQNANLEIVFSGEVEDKIIASNNGELHAEETLNETTLYSYIRWLYQ